MKEGKRTDSEFTPTPHNSFTALKCEEGEELRILLDTEEGGVLLTNYSSCGKYWTNKNANVSVWLNAKYN